MANVLGNHYEYHPEFAPTADILAGYKDKKITWDEYEKKYCELLQKRDPLQNCNISKLDRICLLCTEKTATQWALVYFFDLCNLSFFHKSKLYQ